MANPSLRSGEGNAAAGSEGEVSQQPTTTEARAWTLRRQPTEAKQLLWHRFRAGRLNGHKFRRQVAIDPYIADFVCHAAKLIVELDGSQHVDAANYDERRTMFFEARRWRVLHFWNDDVSQRMDGVLTAILDAIDPPLLGASRLSLPASQGGRL